MGIFDWLRWNRRQPDRLVSLREEYVAAEMRILLDVARGILAANNSMDQIMATTMGLGSAATALRRRYGQNVVEDNSPTEQLISGFADGDKANAVRLLDELISDLRKFEGNPKLTYLRMAWMLRPTEVQEAIMDVK